MLTADELLAGSALSYEIATPAWILHPGEPLDDLAGPRTVRLRPLTVHDLQLITRAAKESGTMMATLMVQRALVDPIMSVSQIAAMHAGLMQFLLREVNRISGIATTADHLAAAVEAPLAKAAYVLAREFGWTPRETNELTLGQIALHLAMLREKVSP
jgi:hypothetical protein